MRRRPYSIVVFDEVEKAHPEVHNMLLQIMEEGHLSDAKGHMVDFRNAIIAMTTNVGAEEIKKQTSLGFRHKRDEKTEELLSYEEMRKKLTESLKKVFRPEFINRVDSVIVFRALHRDEIRQIVNLGLNKVTARLAEHVVTLTASEAALDLLAEQGYDPQMGARPLRRIIQLKVEDPLSDALLSGNFQERDATVVEVEEDDVTLGACRRKKWFSTRNTSLPSQRCEV